MVGIYPGERTRSTWRILLALACVLLVVIAGTVQVAHAHADRAVSHPDCSLCVAAHLTVHLAQTPTPAPAAAIVGVLEVLSPTVIPSALSTFALFTRPPPVAVAPF